MLNRFIYLAIALAVGVGSLTLCRATQGGFLGSAASVFTGAAQSAASAPARLFSGLRANLDDPSELRSQIADLKRENEQLRQEALSAGELRLENQQMRDQLQIKGTKPTLSWIPARVIGYDANPLVHSQTISVGTREGVADGMTVITTEGLVGRVLSSGPTTSRVLLCTDVSSSVNALLQDSRARGVVNGSQTGLLAMRYIGQGDVVRSGDRVLTSGLGGNFPPGLLVGHVVDVRQKDVDMFKESRIEPAVDFDRIEEVLVVTNFLPTKLD
jgi:rod shape-determining protein MreC